MWSLITDILLFLAILYASITCQCTVNIQLVWQTHLRAAAYIPSPMETQICLFRLESYTCGALLTGHKNRGMLFVSQLWDSNVSTCSTYIWVELSYITGWFVRGRYWWYRGSPFLFGFCTLLDVLGLILRRLFTNCNITKIQRYPS